MKIGFLGLGAMGTPMALRLLAAGHELSVWNRTEGRTKPLLREGAIAAATPAEAELGADVLITMFPSSTRSHPACFTFSAAPSACPLPSASPPSTHPAPSISSEPQSSATQPTPQPADSGS